jgi:hypothetical protein
MNSEQAMPKRHYFWFNLRTGAYAMKNKSRFVEVVRARSGEPSLINLDHVVKVEPRKGSGASIYLSGGETSPIETDDDYRALTDGIRGID